MRVSLRNYWWALPVGFVALVAVLFSDRRDPASVVRPHDVDPIVAVNAVIEQRSAVRMRLAREVADGRRQLFEAAALFRELDRVPPAPMSPVPEQEIPLPCDFPATTEGEAYCRRVALFAYIALRDEEPDRAVAVAARLADEVRAEIQARGAVRLPDPATLEPVEWLLREVRGVGRDPPAGITPIGWQPGVHRR